MSYTLHRALVLIGAAVLLSAFAATGAPARELRIAAMNLSERGRLTYDGGGANSITCETVRNGRVGGTIRKVATEVIGRIEEVEVRNCVGGTLIPRNLPWNKTYTGFTGTLPNITGLRSRARESWRARFSALGFECDYGATPIMGTFAAPSGTSFIIDESVTIRSETGLCPEARARGTLTVSPAMTITLI